MDESAIFLMELGVLLIYHGRRV